jgi:hypothetical protein
MSLVAVIDSIEGRLAGSKTGFAGSRSVEALAFSPTGGVASA